MRTVIFSTAHPLDDVRVYSKFARSFAALSERLTWIGPAKAYFSGDSFRDPSFKYSVFRSRPGRLGRLLGIPRSAVRLARHRGADWLYCPDPDAAAIAVLLKPFHRASIIFDIHEEFHTGLLDRWLGTARREVAGRIFVRALRSVVARCDIVIGVNDVVIEPYRSRAKAAIVISNSAPDWFSDSYTPISSVSQEFRFFHGKSSSSNGTEQVLRSLPNLPIEAKVLMIPSSSNPDDPPYMANFESLVNSLGVRDNLLLNSSVPHRDVPALMDTCAVGMIAYGRDLGKASLPNRLFEYMARGRAVMVPVYSPLIRDIVDRFGIGISCDFESPESIAQGIRWFLDNPQEAISMGNRARKAFLEHFSWSSEFSQLKGLISERSPDSWNDCR